MKKLAQYQRGFTLVELLVSVLVFTFVVLAVYTLFDQGAWVYLHSSRRANIQQIARMALEQMERDIRMSGFGVPTGDEFGAGTATWTPDMFTLSPGKIFFRADIDNRHTWVRINVPTASPTEIPVEDPELVCPDPGTSQIVLVDDGRDWQPLLCTASDIGNQTITVNTGAMNCNSDVCEVFSPEHIFYRLTGDADNDGDCDNVGPNDDPFCTIERAVVSGNDPVANSIEANAQFEELATNVVSFNVQQPGLLQIQLTVRDRSMEGPQKYQDVVLTTQILVRDNEY